MAVTVREYPWAAWLLLAALLGGCGGGPRDVRLLGVREVSPAVVEAGGRLSVVGQGFPTGRAGRLELAGVMRSPARPPREVTAALSMRAVSAERLVAVVDGPVLSALGGPGSYAGELRVSFPASDDALRVVGALPVARFDVTAPPQRDVVGYERLRRRANTLLKFLGIAVDGDAESHAGVRIAWTAEGSRAERAGLRRGDMVVAANGVGVHTLGDLAPAPGGTGLVLRVERPGRSQPLRVRLPLSGFGTPRLEGGLVPVWLAAVSVIVAAVLFGPLPAPARLLARGLLHVRTGRAGSPLSVWEPHRPRPTPPSRRLRAHFSRLALPVVVAVGLAALSLLGPAVGWKLGSLSVCMALSGLGIGVNLLLAPDTPLCARGRRAFQQALRMGSVAGAIAIAFAHMGTRSLAGVVAAQGAWPWQWGLFSVPALSALFPACLLLAARHVPLRFGAGAASAALGYAYDVATRGAVCGLMAAVFLGGWQVTEPGQAGLAATTLVGALVFIVKAWSVAWLVQLVRGLGMDRSAHALWLVAGLVAASLGLSVVWLVLGFGPRASVLIGTVAFTAVTLLLAHGALRVFRTYNYG